MRWLSELHKAGKFPHAGVQCDGSALTFQAWNDKLQNSFERVFYIPENPADDHKYKVQPELAHRCVLGVGSCLLYTSPSPRD